VALIEDGARLEGLLVDVGDADPFLEQELRPELLERACASSSIPLTLRVQPGYDPSYYVISTLMGEHLRWHAERLSWTQAGIGRLFAPPRRWRAAFWSASSAVAFFVVLGEVRVCQA